MILETERLLLRPFTLSDAPAIHELAENPDMAATTLNIPHASPQGAAEAYIRAQQENTECRVFGIVRKCDQRLIGGIGLHPDHLYQQAELGYWIGISYWNQGYTCEAVKRMIDYGFADLKLQRIYAGYFSQNLASRHTIENSGMIYEGMRCDQLEHFGKFYDVGYCGILRSEWEAHQNR